MVKRRVLILTASFGDGHNSAARGVAAALTGGLAGEGVEVEVHDLVRAAEPAKGAWLQRGYQFAITHWPWAWRQLYHLTENLPFDDDRLLFLGRVERAMAETIGRFRPGAIVCTFPLYPHLLAKWYGPHELPCPVVTVVTDSITINRVWLTDVASAYCVADGLSAGDLRRRAAAGAGVVESGFPVDPCFETLESGPPASDLPRRVLVFAGGSRRDFGRMLDSLHEEAPDESRLTIVLGRQEARLGAVARSLQASARSRRIEVLGWTREVPGLMASHDLVIGKAGGATTHETAAAGRPMLITQIVPGQEEGNAELVLRRATGWHEPVPSRVGRLLREIVATGAWTAAAQRAWNLRRPGGAREVARVVLSKMLP